MQKAQTSTGSAAAILNSVVHDLSSWITGQFIGIVGSLFYSFILCLVPCDVDYQLYGILVSRLKYFCRILTCLCKPKFHYADLPETFP